MLRRRQTMRAAIVVATVLAGGLSGCGGPGSPSKTSAEHLGAISERVISACHSRPERGSTHELTWGPDGNLWVTQQNQACVVRVTPEGSMTSFALPAGSGPHGIQFDAEGTLWVTLEFKNSIVAMDRNGRIRHEYPIPQPGAGPHGLWMDPDGRTVWWTGKAGDVIGRLDQSTGAMQLFPIPTRGGHPIYIAPGPDHNMWFTEVDGARIGRITEDGRITEFPTPNSASRPIALASRGDRLWVTELGGHAYADIDLFGHITQHPLPRPDAEPYGLAFDASGALWIVQGKPDAIARIAPDGTAKEFRIPTPGALMHRIAAAPDGSMWFTELSTDKLGRIETGLVSSR